MGERIKEIFIEPDRFTQEVSRAFDYNFDGFSYFDCWDKPNVPEIYNIGLIVGASGTGKTTLLKDFGSEYVPQWDNNKAVISHFDSPEDGVEKLSSVGFNSIPSWCKPYEVLSTGEKFRADLARKIHNNSVIDEYTSVVDRNVAKSASVAFSKYVRRKDIKNIVVASCHKDIVEWLEPDWIFDTDNGKLLVGRYLHRPKIEISIYRCKYNLWRMFKNHHYLNGNVNRNSTCYVGIWNGQVVVFTAAIPFPSGNLKNSWREHRTVVLPDYQGMGIGTRFSDAIAQLFIDEGYRFFSRTAHPKMGEYRESSPLWKPTSKNKVSRTDLNIKNGKYKNWFADTRLCYSHEYIGNKNINLLTNNSLYGNI